MLNKIGFYKIIALFTVLFITVKKCDATVTITTTASNSCLVSGQSYIFTVSGYNVNNALTYTMDWNVAGPGATLLQAYGTGVTYVSSSEAKGTSVSSISAQWVGSSTATISVKIDVTDNLGATTSNTYSISLSVVAALSPGMVSNNSQSIGYFATPATINCPVATGGYCSPSYTYQWQQSTDQVNWADITGQTSQNLSFSSPLINSTYYRRRVTESHSNTPLYSTTASVLVASPFSTAAITPLVQNIITGSTGATLSGPAATGGSCSGAYNYQWQSSFTGATNSFTNVTTGTGAATVSYTPATGTPTQTTYYWRKDVCGTQTSYNNIVVINVYPHVTAGTVTPAGPLTITYSTSPGALTSTLATGGYCTNMGYTWQQSTDGTTFSDIPNAGSTTYTPGSLTQTTWFRCKYTCTEILYSNIVKVNVNPQVFPGVIYPGSTVIPTGTSPGQIAVPAATGGACSGNFTYYWQQSTDGTTFTDIAGASGTTYLNYTPGNLTATTWFRRRVTCGIDNLFTNAIKVTVNTGTVLYNYIRARTITKPGVTDEASAAALTDARDVAQATQYFDGLGRVIQTVSRQASPALTDMVAFNQYDEFGRELLKYMPYASTATDGNYKATPLPDQKTFNTAQFAGEQFFYSRTDVEASPLNTVLANYAPGNSWAGSGRGTSAKYWGNTASDAVRIWAVTEAGSSYTFATYATSAVYAAGVLSKSVTIDEHGKQVIEFKDPEGRMILKKVQLTATADDGTGSGYTGWLCTYYIYDDYNNLRCVVQPKGVNLLVANSWNASALSGAILNEQCFRYEYDTRNRMIMKKVPGAGIVYMVYDKRDRLVFTQDANMRGNNQWLATLYDALNRPAQTGMLTYTSGVAALQAYVTANTGNNTNAGSGVSGTGVSSVVPDLYISTRVVTSLYQASNSITIQDGFTGEDGAVFTAQIASANGAGFTNNVTLNDNPLPAGTFIALTITNYDDYTATGKTYDNSNNSKLDQGTDLYPETLPTAASGQTRGMVTSTKVRVIENAGNLALGAWLEAASFYDDKGRAVQVQNSNYKGGLDGITNRYNFAGRVVSNYLVHNNPAAGVSNLRIKTNMDYDAGGRVTETRKTINDDATKTRVTAHNTYNALGQVANKKIGQKTDNTGAPLAGQFLESQDFNYTIRGWLKGINWYNTTTSTIASQVNYQNGKWFGMDLSYDNGFNTKQYNGNIAGMRWSTGDNQQQRAFEFGYDAANRLLSADFTQSFGGTWAKTDPGNSTFTIDFSVKMGDGTTPTTAYDENGNILKMQQMGLKLNTSSLVDNLTYTYYANSNKLKSVVDAVNDPSTLLGDFRTAAGHPQATVKANYTASPGTVDITTITDYGYDVNGNMITDLNKDLGGNTGVDQTGGAIVYNYLNLPWQIAAKKDDGTAKGAITYIYDATGNKLEKRVSDVANNSKETRTAYLTGFVYDNNVLQYFGQEEGRVREKRDATGASLGYVYDYYLKDHLGNTRVTLTDEYQQDVYPVATLESNTAALVTEKSYYDIQDGNIVDESLVTGFTAATGSNYYNNNGNPPYNNNPSANTAAASTKLYKLNGQAGVKTGLGITLRVMTGDVVDIYGKSFYHTGGVTPTNTYLITAALNSFISSLAATPAIAGAGKGATATALNGSPVTTGGLNGLLGSVPNPSAGPRAYINWILFDEQFRPVSSGSGADPVSTTTDVLKNHHQAVAVGKNGYLYVYCSNESNIDVFFDNVQVIQTRGPLLDETHYYPFGLAMGGISSQAAGKLENKLKYNGKEIQHKEFSDGSGLEWEDYGARMYDGQIGRWQKTDDKAELYFSTSPYVFALNQPTNAVDPDGNLVIFINGNHFGNGGTSDYWRGTFSVSQGASYVDDYHNIRYKTTHVVFDRQMMDVLNDHNEGWSNVSLNRYPNGAWGGYFTALDPFFRKDFGHTQGEQDAPNIINHLGRDKNHNITESIKVVSHSMGAAYAKGYITAILEYAKKHPENCIGLTITEIDIAPFQPRNQTSVPGVKTYQFENVGDGVNGWYFGSSIKQENGTIEYHKKDGGEHAATSFGWIFEYLVNIQSLNTSQSSNVSKPPKHKKLGG